MKNTINTVAAWFSNWTADILIASGAASASYGASLIYFPAGFIVGGVLLLAGGIVAARRGD